jgi:hypothetical protein
MVLILIGLAMFLACMILLYREEKGLAFGNVDYVRIIVLSACYAFIVAGLGSIPLG